jgi:long-chain acyl-CoA synthetase
MLNMMPSSLWTVEVTKPGETPDGETPVRRNALSPHALTDTPHPHIRTVFDLLHFSAERWGDTPCFGTRKVIKVHLDGKRVGTNGTRMFWELAPYEYRTYREVVSEVSTLASGLRAMGLEPGDKVAIYAETSYVYIHSQLIFVLTGNWQHMVSPHFRP